MPASSLILPYIVSAKERDRPFTEDMEIASILFLAEAGRRERWILDAASKRTLFVSKLHYPLWAVPWKNGCLVVDGLAFSSSTLLYRTLPDVSLFLEDIERGATVRSQYRDALKKHAQTFSDFGQTVDTPLGAIVANEALLQSISQFVEEAAAQKADVTGPVVLVSPKVNKGEAHRIAGKMLAFYERVQSDIKALRYSIEVLDLKTRVHEQMILKEIRQRQQTCEEEMARARPAVAKRVGQLLQERDARIKRMRKDMERELRPKLRERQRLERELKKLELNRAEYQRRRDIRRRRHDEVGVARWEHRLKASRNRIEDVKGRIRLLSHFIEDTRRQNEEDAERLRFGYQGLIDREREKIVEMENSLRATIESKQDEIDKLWSATKHIMGLMEKLVHEKIGRRTQLEGLAVPLGLSEATMLCLPFWLAGYETRKNIRYRVFAPVTAVSSKGLLKRIQRSIRSFRPASRIKLLLQPRSKALNELFKAFSDPRIRSDRSFEKGLRSLGTSNNILLKSSFKKMLARGADELREEGWISQEESVALVEAYC